MKKIGIILREYKSETLNNLYAIRDDLIRFLRKYDVQTICIPIDFNNNESDELKRVGELIKECHGIILPGGSNYHSIDLKIVNYLYDNNIPTLGICLGMQIMSVAFNGKLSHIENNLHQSKEEYVHQVSIKENSKLATILKDKEIQVNSRHNEYITNTDLDKVAYSKDGILEAVESKSKKFFIGIQWHPESIEKDIYSKRLFDEFIKNLH